MNYIHRHCTVQRSMQNMACKRKFVMEIDTLHIIHVIELSLDEIDALSRSLGVFSCNNRYCSAEMKMEKNEAIQTTTHIHFARRVKLFWLKLWQCNFCSLLFSAERNKINSNSPFRTSNERLRFKYPLLFFPLSYQTNRRRDGEKKIEQF